MATGSDYRISVRPMKVGGKGWWATEVIGGVAFMGDSVLCHTWQQAMDSAEAMLCHGPSAKARRTLRERQRTYRMSISKPVPYEG